MGARIEQDLQKNLCECRRCGRFAVLRCDFLHFLVRNRISDSLVNYVIVTRTLLNSSSYICFILVLGKSCR